MTKVVYNACYGGFGLSSEAIELYAQKTNEKSFSHYDLQRADPILIEVVEELGEKANTRFSDLQIVDIPVGELYRIDEYDGLETVMMISDYNWLEA